MPGHGSIYLLEQLRSNNLSAEALDEFLAGLTNKTIAQAYSDGLTAYFGSY